MEILQNIKMAKKDNNICKDCERMKAFGLASRLFQDNGNDQSIFISI